MLSFVDRFILALLVGPLKADLQISDVQLGLLFGPAFALTYAIVGLPIANLSDRRNRKSLIVAGVLLWGSATVASAFAGAFWVLVCLRVGLAIGEAALTPATYSMLGDLFPPERRALAASIYTAVGMAGASASYIIGGLVIQGVETSVAIYGSLPFSSWQLVLLVVGIPTIVLGVLVWMGVREPERTGEIRVAPSIREILRHLRQHAPLYVGVFVGSGLVLSVNTAYAAWGPELLRRQWDWTAQQAGFAYGLAGLLAGSTGTLALPAVAARLHRAGRTDALAKTMMFGTIVGIPIAVMAPLQSEAGVFLLLYGLASFWLIGSANTSLVVLMTLVPNRMRATLTAICTTCITLVGLGVGPTLVAFISTCIDPSGAALGKGLAVLAVLVAAPALALFAWSRRDSAVRGT